MRFAWTFFAGLVFAALTLAISAPLMAGVGAVAWVLRGELWTTLSGESYFAVRDRSGRTAGQMVNVGFRTMMVAMPGQPRPSRLLVRLEVRNPDVFAADRAGGRVRLDAWALDDADDAKKPALYTILSPGTNATIDEDGLLVVDRGKMKSLYSLSSGQWLFDSDTPTARFTLEVDRHRYAAVATAEDDLPAGAVAVVTYASPQAPVRRLLLTAADPARARILRTAVALTRPVARVDEQGVRVIEVPLPAGTLRLPMAGDDLDLKRASVPAGLGVTEIKPWR